MRDWFVSIKNVKNKTQIAPKMGIPAQRKAIVAIGIATNKEVKNQRQRGYAVKKRTNHVQMLGNVGRKWTVVQKLAGGMGDVSQIQRNVFLNIMLERREIVLDDALKGEDKANGVVLLMNVMEENA